MYFHKRNTDIIIVLVSGASVGKSLLIEQGLTNRLILKHHRS